MSANRKIGENINKLRHTQKLDKFDDELFNNNSNNIDLSNELKKQRFNSIKNECSRKSTIINRPFASSSSSSAAGNNNQISNLSRSTLFDRIKHYYNFTICSNEMLFLKDLSKYILTFGIKILMETITIIRKLIESNRKLKQQEKE